MLGCVGVLGSERVCGCTRWVVRGCVFGGTGYVKRVDKVVNDAVEKDHTREIPPEIVAENDKIKGGDKNKGKGGKWEGNQSLWLKPMKEGKQY